MGGKLQRWCVIHFGGADALVVIDDIDPKKFYWSGGMSYCHFNDDSYIVIECGTFDSQKDYKKINDLFVTFYKTYNLPKEHIEQSAGWLAPDGRFFPCAYWQHDSFATSLAAIYYDSLDATKKLEQMGWIRIYDQGFIGRGRGEKTIPVTKKQLETIQDILKAPKKPSDYGLELSGCFTTLLSEYEQNQ